MPLPQFLLLVLTVVIAAAVTLWISLSAGVPMIVLLLITLMAAVGLHYKARGSADR